jgi:hypothetical protein
MLPTEVYRQEPRILRTPRRFLAVSQPESPLRLAVIGFSEDEARAEFQKRLRFWEALDEGQEQAAHSESVHAAKG